MDHAAPDKQEKYANYRLQNIKERNYCGQAEVN
jgi:hypothetical protein